MKVVINTCFGGFGLSEKAQTRYQELVGIRFVDFEVLDNVRHLERDDAALVRVVEELGEQADSEASKLKVVDIPDGIKWHVVDYDGQEHIVEAHRAWS